MIDIVNRIVHKVARKEESIAEGISLHRQDLLLSTNFNNSLLAIYSISNISEFFNLAEHSVSLATKKHNNIFVATDNREQYIILSRMKHLAGVFMVPRLMQLVNLVDMLDITKILHPLDYTWKTGRHILPDLHILNNDTLYSNIVISEYKPSHIINIYDHENTNDIANISRQTNSVLLTEYINKSIVAPQITPSYTYLPNNKKAIHNPEMALCMAIGLMMSLPYVNYCNSENLFTYLNKYISFKASHP